MSLSEFGYQPMPWANGGGTTWEVARHPADPTGDFRWRVSLAEIASAGPFSTLPGIDRTFTLVSTAPIELLINGILRQAGFGQPLRFSGEDTVACRTAEPATALNVMTRRGSASADVEIVEVIGKLQLDPVRRAAVLVIPLIGSAEVSDGDGIRALRPLQTAAIGHGPVAMAGECTVAVISIAQTGLN